MTAGAPKRRTSAGADSIEEAPTAAPRGDETTGPDPGSGTASGETPRPAGPEPPLRRRLPRDVDRDRGEPLAASKRHVHHRAAGHAKVEPGPLDAWPRRPRILITNDDGVESRGLLALRRALDPIGETFVVAPDTNQSAVGHGKTFSRPLRARERTLADGSRALSIDGYPTDCVSLAFLGLVGVEFDLVASGINYGVNLGDDVTYSGTVSAAMEGVINGCPSMAVSLEYSRAADFRLAALAVALVARNILEHGLPPGQLLNVNVPAISPEECEGIELTRLGRRLYRDELIRRVDPRSVPYYWIGGPPPSALGGHGTDTYAVAHRRVSVTPLHLDLTARRTIDRMRPWNWELFGEEVAVSAAASEEAVGVPESPQEAERDEAIVEEAERERR